MILLKNFFINTTKEIDVVSIIHEINRTVRETGLADAAVTVSVPAPGGALTVIEPLPDIIEQLKEALLIFPGMGLETKNKRKEDIAVGPRVAAAMIGKTLQLSVSKGKLALAPREEVVLIDLENTARRREFCVQVMGDKAECPSRGQPLGKLG